MRPLSQDEICSAERHNQEHNREENSEDDTVSRVNEHVESMVVMASAICATLWSKEQRCLLSISDLVIASRRKATLNSRTMTCLFTSNFSQGKCVHVVRRLGRQLNFKVLKRICRAVNSKILLLLEPSDAPGKHQHQGIAFSRS